MNEKHYVIFCNSKKEFIVVFRGGNTMEAAYRRLRNGCRAYYECLHTQTEFFFDY